MDAPGNAHIAPSEPPQGRTFFQVLFTRRHLRSFALFALCLGAGNFAIEQASPNVFPTALQDKFDYFEKHKDEYDVIFVGSSEINRHVIPKLFAQEMRKRGRPLKAFNFGIGAMGFHENNVLIDRLLALEPQRLRYMIIDPGIGNIRCDRPNWFTDRLIWWHTPRETWNSCRLTLDMPIPLKGRATLMAGHVLHMAMNTFHIGGGAAMLKQTRVAHHLWEDKKRAVFRDGYTSLDMLYRRNDRRIVRRRKEHLRDEAQYVRRLQVLRRALESPPEGPVVVKAWRIEAFAEQVRRVRAAGIEPLYVIPPLLDPADELKALHANGTLPALFAFNDPIRYPVLYRRDLRFDALHLTHDGARAFTLLLVQDFAKFLEDGA